MATFKKVQTKDGTVWRVQLAVQGHRESASRSTKAEAQAWAAERETELRKMVTTGVNTDKTVQDAFDRYLATVSAHKRGQKWERVRLNPIAAHQVDGVAIGALKLASLTPDVLGRWRDMRLAGTKAKDFEDKVKGATIIRDMNLLSHVCSTAVREWKWLAESPTTAVRRPKNSAARSHLITDDEIERQCFALGYDGAVKTKTQAIAAAFLFAIETAMRAGEICGLQREWITKNVAHLPPSITNTQERNQPGRPPISSCARNRITTPNADSGT